ncbi:MAG: phosphoglycerate kinase, partial [Planctomycetota bacterium]|nr:phosphoglycerate kinase [Planctomycetota bacterium]
MKTIDQVDVKGKRVLMRVDFNVPIEGGRIRDDRRIEMALPSIKSVLERGGRLILISHLGRPEGKGYEEEHSLKPCADRLGELLGRSVGFPSNDCIDSAAGDAVSNLQDGEVVVLENLRFHKAEKKGDPEFAGRLAVYGDIYCNDAFGTCHRNDASMVAVPKAMSGRPRVAGFLVAKEVEFFRRALEAPARPFVAVLGGAKVSDKIGAVENLIRQTDAVVIGGAMAYTFLKANGVDVGASRVETERLDDARRMIKLAAEEACDLHLPSDHVCSTEFAERSGDIETFKDAIPAGFMGLDIGPQTQGRFAKVIEKAKTVVWNGPMGVFEWRPFSIGTQQVAAAVAEATERGAVSIVG